MRKFIILTLAMMLVFTFGQVAMGAFEDDPPASHWVYDSFQLVYNAGLLKGYPDGTFRGERHATRYEMVEMIARLMKYFEERLVKAEQAAANNQGVQEPQQPQEPQEPQQPVGLNEEQVKALIAAELAGKPDVNVDEIYTAIQNLERAFKEELAALDVRVTTLEQEVADLKERADALEAKDKELEAKDNELEAKDDELSKKDAELEAKDQELEEQADSNNTWTIIAVILGLLGCFI